MFTIADITDRNIPSIDTGKPVTDALRLMAHNNVSSLFLYDARSFRGLLKRANLAGYPPTRLLVDCPSSPYVAVRYNDPIASILDMLRERGINPIVVKDPTDNPIGIVEPSFLVSMLLEDRGEAVDPEVIARLSILERMASLGQISSGVIHDINNMLGVISGNVSMLLYEAADHSTKPNDTGGGSYAQEIIVATNKCMDLISHFMSMARNPGESPSLEILDIHEIIINSLDLFQSILHASDISIRKHLGATRSMAPCNQSMLQNVLLNLLLNARDSMPSGGGIDIGTADRTITTPFINVFGFTVRQGDYIVISIRDSGCGIDKNDIPKIFKPFFTTKEKGTGLGLANVYRNISAMNGHIDMESVLSSGTTFTIYLPIPSDRN